MGCAITFAPKPIDAWNVAATNTTSTINTMVNGSPTASVWPVVGRPSVTLDKCCLTGALVSQWWA